MATPSKDLILQRPDVGNDLALGNPAAPTNGDTGKLTAFHKDIDLASTDVEDFPDLFRCECLRHSAFYLNSHGLWLSCLYLPTINGDSSDATIQAKRQRLQVDEFPLFQTQHAARDALYIQRNAWDKSAFAGFLMHQAKTGWRVLIDFSLGALEQESQQ
jgi:hypothetical protein